MTTKVSGNIPTEAIKITSERLTSGIHPNDETSNSINCRYENVPIVARPIPVPTADSIYRTLRLVLSMKYVEA